VKRTCALICWQCPLRSISTSFVKQVSFARFSVNSQPMFPVKCVSNYDIELMEILLNQIRWSTRLCHPKVDLSFGNYFNKLMAAFSTERAIYFCKKPLILFRGRVPSTGSLLAQENDTMCNLDVQIRCFKDELETGAVIGGYRSYLQPKPLADRYFLTSDTKITGTSYLSRRAPDDQNKWLSFW
jgi:hypothetical protein